MKKAGQTIDREDFELSEYTEESVFTPENLIEAAIDQKGLQRENVPETCILDPDGDIVRYLVQQGEARLAPNWPCYHSDMYLFQREGIDFGIIGCAVGAPYAVLLAEQMSVLGCQLIISITSAGLLEASIQTPCFMLIEQAIRDEGTSNHYLPPWETAELDSALRTGLEPLIQDGQAICGVSWTTDAPFRETQTRIDAMREQGAMSVEMESSALYAFAQARQKQVICFAHITNEMATRENDFHKGEDDGSEDALKLITATTRLAWELPAHSAHGTRNKEARGWIQK